MAFQKVINIQVLSVDGPTFMPTTKGGYNVLEVAYKEEGKVQGRKLVDFNNKALFQAASQLKPGDHVTIGMNKEPGRDGKEFWQWKQLQVGAAPVGGAERPVQSDQATSAVGQGQSTQPAQTGGNSGVRSGTGRVTGSNYETPEERAARQVYIVRQSSISSAIEYFNTQQLKATVSEVLGVAEIFENYVFGKDVQVAVEEAPAPKKRGPKPKQAVVEGTTTPAPAGDINELENDLPF